MLTALSSITYSLSSPPDEPTAADRLYDACREGDYEVLQGLLAAHKVNINSCNSQHYDWTALHYAADADDPGMVAFLIQHGADPGVQAADGRTPLQWAREVGRRQAQAALEMYAASITTVAGRSEGEQRTKKRSQTNSPALTSGLKAAGVAGFAGHAVAFFLEPLDESCTNGRSAFNDVADLSSEIKTVALQSIDSAAAAGSRMVTFFSRQFFRNKESQNNGALDGDLAELLPEIRSFSTFNGSPHIDEMDNRGLGEEHNCMALSTTPSEARYPRVQSYSTLSVAQSSVTHEDLDADFEFLELFENSRPSFNQEPEGNGGQPLSCASSALSPLEASP